MKPFYRGKVRDLYEAGPDSMVLVATDRLSAFDVVFPDPVPGKGRVLTRVSSNWFAAIRSSGLEQKLDFTDHIIETNVDQFPKNLRLEEWKDRAVLAKKTKRIDFECVVRGYLAGSAFKEYRETGTVCGESLPPGLLQADKLPSPIFTPATKAETGHDENISFSAMKSSIGDLEIGRAHV